MIRSRIAVMAGTIAGAGALGATAAFTLGTVAPSTRLASAQISGTAATVASPATACDDGAWHGVDGIRVQGRPDGLDAGDNGTTYVWHDGDGWHVRSTDPAGKKGHYTGVITLSAGHFVDASTVRLEKDDHVEVGDRTLRYSFDTIAGIDGVDFHVSACGGDRTHEVLTFAMRKNGSDDDARRIDVGDHRQHPDRSTWRAARDAVA